MQLGTSECASDLTNLETRVVGSDGTESKGTEDGVVVAKVFPLLPQERNGPNKTAVAEVYLNPNHVSSAQEVKPWNFKALQCDKPGVCVVLGAGNYVNLTVTDVLHQLYHQNQVVFVKHHPIRGALDPWLRFIFQSLFDHGYLDSELDVDTARSQSIVYSPLVQGVHMTGGKLTHDRLVWGTTLAEQAKRRKEQTPKLTAHMTSELGAVTPHIVTPVHYTDKELDFQAQVLVSAKWINGGASCNSPQVVVFSDEWPQQRQFLDRVEHHWKKLECPIAYYPGTTDRVQAFENHYGTNDATQQSSSSTASVTTARWMGKLPPNSHDMHMPLYTIHMSNVDVSTPDALEAAKKEYAFANEAFGPVLVFATLKTTSTSKGNHDTATDESVHVDRFMDQAVDFCNKALFGTLSCSVVVPDWAQQKPYLERTLAKLQYGGVALNAWGAVCYGPKFGTWGGYMPAEELENVQSGIGHVHNVLFLPHVDKTVMRYRSKSFVGGFVGCVRRSLNSYANPHSFALFSWIYSCVFIIWWRIFSCR